MCEGGYGRFFQRSMKRDCASSLRATQLSLGYDRCYHDQSSTAVHTKSVSARNWRSWAQEVVVQVAQHAFGYDRAKAKLKEKNSAFAGGRLPRSWKLVKESSSRLLVSLRRTIDRLSVRELRRLDRRGWFQESVCLKSVLLRLMNDEGSLSVVVNQAM